MTANTRTLASLLWVMKACSLLLGLLLALGAIGAAIALSVGRFEEGRGATLAMAVLMALGAASLLAFPYSPRIGKALGVLALLCLAGGMLVAVFSPDMVAAEPGRYQLGAIALAVLLIARLVRR